MMGVVGDTEESIRRTSDFVIELGLDDMNMSKFTPFPGAPCWDTIGAEGTLDEDWRLMNCMNFVFVPKGIESRERLEQLYSEHVKRFYTDPAWRRKFTRRLLQHRHSLRHMALELPSFLAEGVVSNRLEKRGSTEFHSFQVGDDQVPPSCPCAMREP
jgi:radical SAM superfamily enzyme YgiQ (UPF0313 family)